MTHPTAGSAIVGFFSKFRIGWLMRMVSALSLGILLGVIGLNYYSIGSVQALNTHLIEGPMTAKDRWNEVALSQAQAEMVRMGYLADPQDKTAQAMAPLMAAMRDKSSALGQTAASVNKELNEYEKAFGELASAMQANGHARAKLMKNREKVEELVYESSIVSLETALNEFLLGEMAYFADKNQDRVRTVRVALDRLNRDGAEMRNAGELSKAVEAYRQTYDSIVANLETIALRSKQMEQHAAAIHQAVEQGVGTANDQAAAAARQAVEQAASAQRNALIWTLIGMTAAIFFSQLFERALNKRVNLTLQGLQRIARGEINHRFSTLPGARNELCLIMNATNDMADNLSSLLRVVLEKVAMIHEAIQHFDVLKTSLAEQSAKGDQMVTDVVRRNAEVDDNTKSVFDLSEKNEVQTQQAENKAREFLGIIQSMADAAEMASANVSTTAAAAEEMSANVAGVKSNLEQVDQSVNTVAAAVEELEASLGEVRKRCLLAESESKRAGGSVHEANDAMQRLDKAAVEIDNVVAMINQIAQQTNMLALNASIEAAGAGEAGKGFAVVANEVKELARETAKATSLIVQRVKEVQNLAKEVRTSMDQVVMGIGEVMTVNGEIVHAVDEQSHTTQEISRSMDQVSHAANAVTRNAVELESASREVAMAAAESARGVEQIAQSAESASAGARRIADDASQTRSQSLEMKGKTQEIFAVSGEVQKLGLIIFDVMQFLQKGAVELADQTRRLQEGARELKSTSSRFKVDG
ncbi:MAG: hypothetical protein HQL51_16535 [Magnetococcales bacterium]|nr:hypothetical protein [Magnetococcales bacterium]